MSQLVHETARQTTGFLLDPRSADRLLPAADGASWLRHLGRLGRVPELGSGQLAGAAATARLTGRGGAAFPTAKKISVVAAAVDRTGLPAVVVANCCESDPTSLKDQVMVAHSPHLVIDGALAAAAAIGADRVLLAVHDNSAARSALTTAVAERPRSAIDVRVIAVPDRYIASEATALVHFLNTGDARPTGRSTPIWDAGVGGRPTLVDNAETLGQLALLARFGAHWFAGLGTETEPGTTLVTVGGAVTVPGVVEVSQGTAIGAILGRAGARPPAWSLIGGLSGRWADLATVADSGWATDRLADVGLVKGVGSIVVLPPGGCPLIETARILRHQADAGARQCGPCMFGLPAIADDFGRLIGGDRGAIDRLRRRLPVINGRGACGHPDGAVALAASALSAMHRSGHLGHHLTRGRCSAPPAVVPLRAAPTGLGLPVTRNRWT